MQKRLKQQIEAEKPDPLSSQLLQRIFKSGKSKEMVKWGQNEPRRGFYRLLGGLVAWHTFLGRRVSPTHLEGPPVSIDWLTRSNLQKKKGGGGAFPHPNFRDMSRKYFKSNCSRAIQLDKVQSQFVNSLRMQFRWQQNSKSHSLSDTSHCTRDVR